MGGISQAACYRHQILVIISSISITLGMKFSGVILKNVWEDEEYSKFLNKQVKGLETRSSRPKAAVSCRQRGSGGRHRSASSRQRPVFGPGEDPPPQTWRAIYSRWDLGGGYPRPAERSGLSGKGMWTTLVSG